MRNLNRELLSIMLDDVEQHFQYGKKWVFEIKNLVFILLALPFINYAQQPVFTFENFDHIQPIPDALDIIQDQEGYLWIATFDGLWKFDGYDFETFRIHDKLSLKNPSNIIRTVMEDSLGRIWHSSPSLRIFYSNQEKNEFNAVPIELKSNRINSLLMDPEGNIWIGGNEGVQIIREEHDGSFNLNHNHPIHKMGVDSYTNSFYYDKRNSVWIGSRNGLIRYHLTDQTVTTYFQNHPLNITDIQPDPHGNIWFASNGGKNVFYKYSDQSSEMIPIDDFDIGDATGLTRFCFDQDNRIWISFFGSSLLAFNLDDHSLYLNNKEHSNLNHLRFFRRVISDQSGDVWVLGDGPYKLKAGKGFKSFIHASNFTQSNSSIFVDWHNMWAAYREKGLYNIDRRSNQMSSLFAENLPSGIGSSETIYDIKPIRDSNLLIAGIEKLHILNQINNQVQEIPLSGVNRYVYQDHWGILWVANQYGLYEMNEDFTFENHFELIKEESRDEFFQTIVEDHNQDLWIATDGNGLIKFDRQENRLVPIPLSTDKTGLTSKRINDLLIDQNHNLWLGTDLGLIRKNQDGYVIYDVRHGLVNAFIASLLEDDNGYLWVATNNGLAKFDPINEVFTNYNKKDGCINAWYYPRVRAKSPEGYLYFGGRRGIDFFNPESIDNRKSVINLVLRDIELSDGKKIYPQYYETISGSIIQAQRGFIRVRFTATNVSSPEDIRYAYKINKLSDQWFELGKEREILLSNLKPGHYQISLKAYEISDPKNGDQTELAIRVPTPFYLHPIFILLLVVAGILGTFLIINRREKNIRLKEKASYDLKKQMIALEQKALRSQMNPHFIFNSMNSIQDFILTNDPKGAMKFLNKFSRLLRQVLNYSAQPKIPLSEEVQLLKDYLDLELMRFPHKYAYTIDIDPSVSVHSTEIPPFLIQPLVENSIIHGFKNLDRPGQIGINIDQVGEILNIQVEDNGVGRNAQSHQNAVASKNGGLGLSIIQQRVEMLNDLHSNSKMEIQDIQDRNGNATGTKVVLTLPID